MGSTGGIAISRWAYETMQADDDPQALVYQRIREYKIGHGPRYVAQHAARMNVEWLSDYVLFILSGVPSYARLGCTQKKLVDFSRTARRALDGEFGADLVRVADGLD